MLEPRVGDVGREVHIAGQVGATERGGIGGRGAGERHETPRRIAAAIELPERRVIDRDLVTAVAIAVGSACARLERFLTVLNHKGIPVAAVF